jgi:predicted ABC-type ATPase
LPTLTIIAGRNGSGKSTLASALAVGGHEHLIDPDRIARSLNPATPERAVVRAGRQVLDLVSRHLRAQESFAIETTLASRRTLGMIHTAQRARFEVHLVYIGLDSPERCIGRVRERVRHGGHDVPPAVVHRRYWRSIENAPLALCLVDRATLFDNSSSAARKVLELSLGAVVWRAPDEPQWCQRIRAALSPAT